MKSKINSVILGLFISIFVFASTAKSQHKEFEQWKELKAFHEVISSTFHPMEDKNFKPIRERSAELNKAAITLAQSTIPKELNTPEIASTLNELLVRTKELDDLIWAKAEDEKVKTSLTSVHDTFHKIVGLCSKEDKSKEDKKSEKKHEGSEEQMVK